jgi:ribonuclease P/MRP protein subunit RPP20
VLLSLAHFIFGGTCAGDGGTMRSGKTPPLSTEQYRGPNHVLVSRRTAPAALVKRTRKLLGKWKEVHVHGLGAAISTAVALAAQLVLESDGKLAAWTSTSTEMLIDRPDSEDDEESWPAGLADAGGAAGILEGDASGDACPRVRFNSAVHIRLTAPAT